MFKFLDDGCQIVVYCVVVDGLREEFGKFFENCRVVFIKDYVRDKVVCKNVWFFSFYLCGLDEMYFENKLEFVVINSLLNSEIEVGLVN